MPTKRLRLSTYAFSAPHPVYCALSSRFDFCLILRNPNPLLSLARASPVNVPVPPMCPAITALPLQLMFSYWVLRRSRVYFAISYHIYRCLSWPRSAHSVRHAHIPRVTIRTFSAPYFLLRETSFHRVRCICQSLETPTKGLKII